MFTLFLKMTQIIKKTFLLYIGKNDVLPQPLNKEEERELLFALSSGNQHAKDILIEHNLRLVIYAFLGDGMPGIHRRVAERRLYEARSAMV